MVIRLITLILFIGSTQVYADDPCGAQVDAALTEAGLGTFSKPLLNKESMKIQPPGKFDSNHKGFGYLADRAVGEQPFDEAYRFWTASMPEFTGLVIRSKGRTIGYTVPRYKIGLTKEVEALDLVTLDLNCKVTKVEVITVRSTEGNFQYRINPNFCSSLSSYKESFGKVSGQLGSGRYPTGVRFEPCADGSCKCLASTEKTVDGKCRSVPKISSVEIDAIDNFFASTQGIAYAKNGIEEAHTVVTKLCDTYKSSLAPASQGSPADLKGPPAKY